MRARIRRLTFRLPAALCGRGATLRALYFFFYGSGAVWLPFFTIYLRQLGLSGLQIGVLAGVRPAVVLLSQPLWGLVADLRGRRRTLLLTMLLAALLPLGFAWPGGFGYLFGWTVVWALLTNPVGPLIDSLVLDHLETRRASSFGELRLWGAVGWAAAALLAGRVVTGRDLRLIFPLVSGLTFVGWTIAWRGTHDPQGEARLERDWRGAGALLRNRALTVFLTLIVLAQLGAVSVMTFYPVYVAELGAPRQLIGLAYTLQGLSEMPFYLAAAGIIRRLSTRRTLVLAFLVFAARMLLYSIIKAPRLAVAVEACHGLSFSLLLVASVEYVNRQVPAEWRATGQTLLSAAYFGAGGILGNAWAGYLYDRLGVQGMFRLNGWLLVAVAILASALLRAGRRQGPCRPATGRFSCHRGGAS